MTSHVDILDAPERLSKPFWTSLILHVSIAAVILVSGKLDLLTAKKNPFGDPMGGRAGSVSVGVTDKIPLPAKSGAFNPVANDSQFQIPTPPTKAKPQPKATPKAPEPDAIPLTRKERERLLARAFSEPKNTFREKQPERSNQVYSQTGQSVSSPMYGVQGAGVGVGTNSPFGTQFGWYATQLRDQVARKWQPGDAGRGAPEAIVTFTILRNGSVAPDSVRISQSSGNRAFDFAAQRAVLDAAPFPPLPAGFSRNDATVELHFELRR